MAKVNNVSIQTLQTNGKLVAQQQLSDKNITIDASDNQQFKLIDEASGQSPEQIITQKQGDDLVIKLSEQANQPTITINNFYVVENSQVVGVSTNGDLYSYNLATSNVETTSLLAEHISTATVASSSSIAFNPWYVVGGAAAIGGVALAAGGGGGSGGSNGGSGGGSSYNSGELNNSRNFVVDTSAMAKKGFGLSGEVHGLDFLIQDAGNPRKVEVTSNNSSVVKQTKHFDEDSDYGFSISRNDYQNTNKFNVKVTYSDGSTLSKNYKIIEKDAISSSDFDSDNNILIFKNFANGSTIDMHQGDNSLIYNNFITTVNGVTLKGDYLEYSRMAYVHFKDSTIDINHGDLNVGNLSGTNVTGVNLGIEARGVYSSNITLTGTNKGLIDMVELGDVKDSIIKLSAGHSTLVTKNLSNSKVDLGDGFDNLTINATEDVVGNSIDGGAGRDVLTIENGNWNEGNARISIDSSQFKGFEWIAIDGAIDVHIKHADLAADKGREGALGFISNYRLSGDEASKVVFDEPEKWKKVGVKELIYKANDSESLISEKLFGNMDFQDDDLPAPQAYKYDQYHYDGDSSSNNDVFVVQHVHTNII